MAFGFTTKKPRKADNFLKNDDGSPMLLKKGLRLAKPIYLQIPPPEKALDRGDAKRLTRFDQWLFDQVIKEFAQLLLGDMR